MAQQHPSQRKRALPYCTSESNKRFCGADENVLWLLEGTLSATAIKSVLAVIRQDNVPFMAKDSVEDLSAGLFNIVTSALAAEDTRLSRVNKMRLVSSGGIVARLCAGPGCEKRVHGIEDAAIHTMLAVPIAIHKDVFENGEDAAAGCDEPSNLDMLMRDIVRTKNRWAILEKVSSVLSEEGDTESVSTRSFITRAIRNVKRGLFKNLIKSVNSYGESGAYYVSQCVAPIDVSFAVSMIDDVNYSEVNKGVEKNIITFFPCLTPHPEYHGQLDDEHPSDYLDGPYAWDGEHHHQRQSKLGVYWKHKKRNAALRDSTIKASARKLFGAVYDGVTVSSSSSSSAATKQIQAFDGLVYRLNTTQFFGLIGHWSLPSSLLLHALQSTATLLKHPVLSLVSHTVVSGGLRMGKWHSSRFGWLLERVVEEVGLDAVPNNLMDAALQAMINLNCLSSFEEFLKKHKDSFSVERVKNLALFMTSRTNLSDGIFATVFEHFPWLLNTWIDHGGNTLLCLCVSNGYTHLNKLLDMDIVKKHINVESKDGINPLMLAADLCYGLTNFCSIVLVGGADTRHVNRHHESVLHRVAGSNNVQVLGMFARHPAKFKRPDLELRRKGDAATPLMIALARQHLDVASTLMDMGALATTKFGPSETLRTVEAVVLKNKSMSMAFLAERGFNPMSSIVAHSFMTGALFDEEGAVAPTGMVDIGRVCTRPFVGMEMKRMEKKKKKKDGGINRLCMDDLTWTLFGDQRSCSRLKWPSYVINNKPEELAGVVGAETMLDFGNEVCSICLGPFDEEAALGKKGITTCGHAFHDRCWRQLGDGPIHRCPVCRKAAPLKMEDCNGFAPEPVVATHPPRELRKYRITPGEEGPNARVARYQFFINDQWLDESSQLNVIL